MQAIQEATTHRLSRWAALGLVGWALASGACAADKKETPPTRAAAQADIEATTVSNPKDVASKVREALGVSILPNKKLILNLNSA